MKEEFIPRSAALSKTHDIHVKSKAGDVDYYHRCIDPSDIEEIPAADVRKVVHGKWNAVKGALHPAETSAVCSNCGFATMIHAQTFYHFCPNCGADMRQKEENNGT